jgi:hypothetical protein
MFNYIINFFKTNQTQKQSDIHIQKQPPPETYNPNQLFNQQYRIAYNKLWIKKIRNYYP